MHHTTIKDIDAQRTSKIPPPSDSLLPIISKKQLSLSLKLFYLSYPQKGMADLGESAFWAGEPVKNGTEVNVFFRES